MKVKTSKGFTLAELLIVMAIIVVLAAVAIPTFGKQLETARETGDMEIIRSAYTEALSMAILDAADGTLNGVIGDGTKDAENDGSTGAVRWVKNTTGYKVVLAELSTAPKFAQNRAGSAALTADTVMTAANVGAWTYVSDQLMNRTVPPVCVETKTVTFNFEIADGEVKLVAQPGASDTTSAKPIVMGIT